LDKLSDRDQPSDTVRFHGKDDVAVSVENRGDIDASQVFGRRAQEPDNSFPPASW
jgi:hypothetical protein